MTEAERYEGKQTKPKKRNPQQEWMDVVESSVATAPNHLKSHLRTMAGLDNIPRKEKQFRNFTENSLSLRGKDAAILGEIWNLLKKEHNQRQAQKEKERQQKEQKRKKEVEEKKLAEEVKKTTAEESSDDEPKEEKPSNETIDKKKVTKAMKKALKKAPNRSMKIKVLRKQLCDQLGLSKNANKLLKELVLQAPKESKKSKIVVDGKIISLM
jgi:hypothetical protein